MTVTIRTGIAAGGWYAKMFINGRLAHVARGYVHRDYAIAAVRTGAIAAIDRAEVSNKA